MDKVLFVTIEKGPDMVLSFSFEEDTRFGVDGFIIQRSPKYEFILKPFERGPSVDWPTTIKLSSSRKWSCRDR
ncbi:MAG: hypothetical protein ACE5HS_22070 [bacterium]